MIVEPTKQSKQAKISSKKKKNEKANLNRNSPTLAFKLCPLPPSCKKTNRRKL
jgi:hypothetical protein